MRKARTQESAGGVVWEDRRILLIRTRTRSGRSVWTLPKGRVEEGESYRDTALREVREETGYVCDLLNPLPQTSYQFWVENTRIDKTVHWFLMRPGKKVGSHDRREVDEARWVPLREAFSKLSYRSDQDLLAEAERLVSTDSPYESQSAPE